MKKILSLCLTIVMFVSLLAGFTVNAVSTDGDYEYYYFNPSNISAGDGVFSVRETADAYYGDRVDMYIKCVNRNSSVQSTPTEETYRQNSGLYHYQAVTANPNATNDVTVYVTTPGTYKVFMLVPHKNAPLYSIQSVAYTAGTFQKNNSSLTVGVNEGTKVAFGDEEYNYTDSENYTENVQDNGTLLGTGIRYDNIYYWDSAEFTFVEGENTINFKAGGSGAKIGAMFITNNLELTSDKLSFVGSYQPWAMNGTYYPGAYGDRQEIMYFADGEFHANPAAEGIINMLDYSDNKAPTLTVDPVEEAGRHDNSIDISWTADDAPWVESNGAPVKYMGGNGLRPLGSTANQATSIGQVDPRTPTYAADIKHSDASGVYSIKVYEGDTLKATLPGTATGYTFEDLDEGSEYIFKVEVMDHYGFVATQTVTATTTGTPDSTNPWWTSEDITAEESFTTATITWPEANDDRSLIGYDIYVDSSFVETVLPSVREYTVEVVPEAPAKEFKVIARDRAGHSTTPLTIEVAAAIGNTNILFRPLNFNMPAGYWTYAGSWAALRDEGMFFGNYLRGDAVSSEEGVDYLTAKFYIESPGEHILWIHAVGDNTLTAYIDGERIPYRYHSTATVPKYKWDMPAYEDFATVELTKGWHELAIDGAKAGGQISAFYITDNLNATESDVTFVNSANIVEAGKFNLYKYEDKTAPVISAFTATALGNDSIELEWTATDNVALAEIEVYQDGEKIDTIDGDETSYTIEGLEEASSYEYEIVVKDFHAYSAKQSTTGTTTGTPTVVAPEWPADAELTVNSAAVQYVLTWPEATDDVNVFKYVIYKDGSEVDRVLGSELTYTGTMSLGESFTASVKALDKAGNFSDAIEVAVESKAGSENFFLRMEEFTYPVTGGSDLFLGSISSDDVNMLGALYVNYPKHSMGTTADTRTVGQIATAEIYIDAEDDYALFANLTQKGIPIKLGIDGNYSSHMFGEVKSDSTWMWEKATDKTWHLTPGWHTVEVVSMAMYAEVAAIYITNGLDVVTSELSYARGTNEPIVDGKLNLASYEDVFDPEFTGELTYAYDSATGNVTITWPEATEKVVTEGTYTARNTGIHAYQVTINDNEAVRINDPLARNFVIENVALGDVLKIKVEALDGHGRKAALTSGHTDDKGFNTYTVSKFVIPTFAVKNSLITATTLADFDGTVTAALRIKNISDTSENIRLSIAVYDPSGNMVAKNLVDDQTIATGGVIYELTATVTGVPALTEGYIVKAHLWDADDLSPIADTIVISE